MKTDAKRIEQKALHNAIKGFTGRFEKLAGSDDLFLKLPEEFLKSEDWRLNDVLSFEILPGQAFRCRVLGKVNRSTYVPNRVPHNAIDQVSLMMLSGVGRPTPLSIIGPCPTIPGLNTCCVWSGAERFTYRCS